MSNAVKEIIANHFELFKKWKEEEKQFNILCTIGFGKHWEDTLNMLQKEDTRIEQKCSTIWYGSEKAYKCRTCGLDADSSAAICQACFDPEKHIGHDYQMIHATGGTCDCGSDDAWQKSGWCSRHLSNRNKNISPLETFNNSNISLNRLCEWIEGMLHSLCNCILLIRFKINKLIELYALCDIMKTNAYYLRQKILKNEKTLKDRKSYSKLDMREEDYEKLIIKFCKLSKYKKHILQSIILKILGALLGEAQLACQETTQPQIIVKNWKEALVKSISELKSVLLCEKEKDAKKCSTMLGTSEFEGENKEDECHCESEDKHISLKSIQLGNMKKFETRNDRHDEEVRDNKERSEEEKSEEETKNESENDEDDEESDDEDEDVDEIEDEEEDEGEEEENEKEEEEEEEDDDDDDAEKSKKESDLIAQLNTAQALLIFSPEELRFLFEEEQKWKRSQEAECLHDKQTSNEMTIKEQNEDKSREKSDKIEEAPFITSEQTEKLYKSESFSTLSETQVLQSIFFIATLSPISWLSSSNSSFFFGIPESNEQNAHQIHFSPIKSELTGLQSASSLSSQSLSSSSSSSVYVPSASFINSLIFSFLSLPLYLAFRSYFLDVAKSIYLYVSECKIKVLATLLDTLHKLIEKSSGIRHLVMVGLMNKRPKNPLKHQSTFNRCAEAWISGYPPLSEQEKDIRGVKKEAKPQDLLVFEDDNTNKEAEDLNNSTYFGYFRSYSPERCSEMAEATSNYSSLAASPINHLNTISPTNAMESKSIMDIHINNFVDKDSLPENAPSSSFLSQNSQLPLHPDDEKTILPNISTCGTFSLHELIDYLEQHRNSLPNPDNKLTSPFPFIAFTDTVFYFLLDSIRMLPAVEFMQFLLPLTLERTFSATQVKCWFDRLNTISVHAIPSECGWVQNGESKAEVNKRMNKRWKEVKNFVEQDRIERILGIKNEDNCKNNESQNKKDDKKVKTMIKIRRERNLHSKNILQHFSCVNSSLQKIMKQKIKEKVKHKKAELSEKKKKEEEEKDNTKSKKQNGIGEWNELDSWLYEFDKDYLFYDVEDCSKILNLQGIICAAEHDESSTVSVQMTPQLCLTIREINPDFLIFADLSFIHNILGLNATPSIEFWLDYFKTIGLDYYEYYDINVDYMEKVKNGLESQRYRLNWILFMIEEEQKKKMLIEIQTKGKEMKTDAVQTLQKCYTSQFPSSCFLSSLHSFADIQFFNTEIMYMFSDEVWAGCRGCINYLGIPYYAALLADGMKHLSLFDRWIDKQTNENNNKNKISVKGNGDNEEKRYTTTSNDYGDKTSERQASNKDSFQSKQSFDNFFNSYAHASKSFNTSNLSLFPVNISIQCDDASVSSSSSSQDTSCEHSLSSHISQLQFPLTSFYKNPLAAMSYSDYPFKIYTHFHQLPSQKTKITQTASASFEPEGFPQSLLLLLHLIFLVASASDQCPLIRTPGHLPYLDSGIKEDLFDIFLQVEHISNLIAMIASFLPSQLTENDTSTNVLRMPIEEQQTQHESEHLTADSLDSEQEEQKISVPDNCNRLGCLQLFQFVSCLIVSRSSSLAPSSLVLPYHPLCSISKEMVGNEDKTRDTVESANKLSPFLLEECNTPTIPFLATFSYEDVPLPLLNLFFEDVDNQSVDLKNKEKEMFMKYIMTFVFKPTKPIKVFLREVLNEAQRLDQNHVPLQSVSSFEQSSADQLRTQFPLSLFPTHTAHTEAFILALIQRHIHLEPPGTIHNELPRLFAHLGSTLITTVSYHSFHALEAAESECYTPFVPASLTNSLVKFFSSDNTFSSLYEPSIYLIVTHKTQPTHSLVLLSSLPSSYYLSCCQQSILISRGISQEYSGMWRRNDMAFEEIYFIMNYTGYLPDFAGPELFCMQLCVCGAGWDAFFAFMMNVWLLDFFFEGGWCEKRWNELNEERKSRLKRIPYHEENEKEKEKEQYINTFSSEHEKEEQTDSAKIDITKESEKHPSQTISEMSTPFDSIIPSEPERAGVCWSMSTSESFTYASYFLSNIVTICVDRMFPLLPNIEFIQQHQKSKSSSASSSSASYNSFLNPHPVHMEWMYEMTPRYPSSSDSSDTENGQQFFSYSLKEAILESAFGSLFYLNHEIDDSKTLTETNSEVSFTSTSPFFIKVHPISDNSSSDSTSHCESTFLYLSSPFIEYPNRFPRLNPNSRKVVSSCPSFHTSTNQPVVIPFTPSFVASLSSYMISEKSRSYSSMCSLLNPRFTQHPSFEPIIADLCNSSEESNRNRGRSAVSLNTINSSAQVLRSLLPGSSSNSAGSAYSSHSSAKECLSLAPLKILLADPFSNCCRLTARTNYTQKLENTLTSSYCSWNTKPDEKEDDAQAKEERRKKWSICLYKGEELFEEDYIQHAENACSSSHPIFSSIPKHFLPSLLPPLPGLPHVRLPHPSLSHLLDVCCSRAVLGMIWTILHYSLHPSSVQQKIASDSSSVHLPSFGETPSNEGLLIPALRLLDVTICFSAAWRVQEICDIQKSDISIDEKQSSSSSKTNSHLIFQQPQLLNDSKHPLAFPSVPSSLSFLEILFFPLSCTCSPFPSLSQSPANASSHKDDSSECSDCKYSIASLLFALLSSAHSESNPLKLPFSNLIDSKWEEFCKDTDSVEEEKHTKADERFSPDIAKDSTTQSTASLNVSDPSLNSASILSPPSASASSASSSASSSSSSSTLLFTSKLVLPLLSRILHRLRLLTWLFTANDPLKRRTMLQQIGIRVYNSRSAKEKELEEIRKSEQLKKMAIEEVTNKEGNEEDFEEKEKKANKKKALLARKRIMEELKRKQQMAMKAFGMMEEDGKENEENKSDNVVEKKENSNKEDNKEDTKESVAQSNDSKTNQCEIEVDSVESEKKKEELKKQQISAIDAEIAELENQLEKMEAEEETSEVCMYCHGAILKGESAGYIGHLSYDSTLQALNSSAVYHLRDEEERKRKAMEKERREKKDEKRRKKHKHKGKVLTRCHRWNFAKREHFWEDGDFLDEIERVKTAENAMEKGIHKKQAVLQSDCSVKDTMEQPIREKDTDSLDLTHGPLYSSSTTKDVPFSFMLMPFREKGANEDSLLDASKELEPSKTMHLTALPLFHFPKETSKFGDDSSELIGNNMKGLNTPAGFEKHFFGTNKQAVVNELAKFTEQRHRIQTVKKEERFVKWASSYFKMLDKMKKKMKKNKVKFLIKKKAKDKHIQEKEKTKKKRDWEKESRKAEKDEEKYEKALFWKKQDEDEEDEVNEAEKKIYNEQKIESLSTNIAMKLSLHVEKEQDALKEEQSTESSSSNCLLHAPDSDSSTTSDFPFTDNSENDEKNPNQSKPLSSASSRENYSSFIANHRRVPLFRAPEGPLKMRRLSKRNEIEKYLFKLEKWGRELNEWNLAMDTSGCDECGQQSYELNSDESSQSSQKLSNQTSASFSTSFHSLLDSQALQEEKVSLWNQIALGTKTDLWGNSGRDDLVIEDIRYTSTDLSPILECAFPFLPVYSTYDFSSENEASTIATESKKEAQDFSLSNMNYLKLFNLLKLIRIWSYNEEEYTWNPILNIPLNHLTKLIYARQTEDKSWLFGNIDKQVFSKMSPNKRFQTSKSLSNSLQTSYSRNIHKILSYLPEPSPPSIVSCTFFTQTCTHVIHFRCLAAHILREGGKQKEAEGLITQLNQFHCPLCHCVGNTFIPLLSGLDQESTQIGYRSEETEERKEWNFSDGATQESEKQNKKYSIIRRIEELKQQRNLRLRQTCKAENLECQQAKTIEEAIEQIDHPIKDHPTQSSLLANHRLRINIPSNCFYSSFTSLSDIPIHSLQNPLIRASMLNELSFYCTYALKLCHILKTATIFDMKKKHICLSSFLNKKMPDELPEILESDLLITELLKRKVLSMQQHENPQEAQASVLKLPQPENFIERCIAPPSTIEMMTTCGVESAKFFFYWLSMLIVEKISEFQLNKSSVKELNLCTEQEYSNYFAEKMKFQNNSKNELSSEGKSDELKESTEKEKEKKTEENEKNLTNTTNSNLSHLYPKQQTQTDTENEKQNNNEKNELHFQVTFDLIEKWEEKEKEIIRERRKRIAFMESCLSYDLFISLDEMIYFIRIWKHWLLDEIASAQKRRKELINSIKANTIEAASIKEEQEEKEKMSTDECKETSSDLQRSYASASSSSSSLSLTATDPITSDAIDFNSMHSSVNNIPNPIQPNRDAVSNPILESLVSTLASIEFGLRPLPLPGQEVWDSTFQSRRRKRNKLQRNQCQSFANETFPNAEQGFQQTNNEDADFSELKSSEIFQHQEKALSSFIWDSEECFVPPMCTHQFHLTPPQKQTIASLFDSAVVFAASQKHTQPLDIKKLWVLCDCLDNKQIVEAIIHMNADSYLSHSSPSYSDMLTNYIIFPDSVSKDVLEQPKKELLPKDSQIENIKTKLLSDPISSSTWELIKKRIDSEIVIMTNAKSAVKKVLMWRHNGLTWMEVNRLLIEQKQNYESESEEPKLRLLKSDKPGFVAKELCSFVGSDPLTLLVMLLIREIVDGNEKTSQQGERKYKSSWKLYSLSPYKFVTCLQHVLNCLPFYCTSIESKSKTTTDETAGAESVDLENSVHLKESSSSDISLNELNNEKELTHELLVWMVHHPHSPFLLSPWFDPRNASIQRHIFLRRASLLFTALFGIQNEDKWSSCLKQAESFISESHQLDCAMRKDEEDSSAQPLEQEKLLADSIVAFDETFNIFEKLMKTPLYSPDIQNVHSKSSVASSCNSSLMTSFPSFSPSSSISSLPHPSTTSSSSASSEQLTSVHSLNRQVDFVTSLYVSDLDAMTVYSSPSDQQLLIFFSSFLCNGCNMRRKRCHLSRDNLQGDYVYQTESFNGKEDLLSAKRKLDRKIPLTEHCNSEHSLHLTRPNLLPQNLLLPRLVSLPLSLLRLISFGQQCHCTCCGKLCGLMSICMLCGKLMCSCSKCCQCVVNENYQVNDLFSQNNDQRKLNLDSNNKKNLLFTIRNTSLSSEEVAHSSSCSGIILTLASGYLCAIIGTLHYVTILPLFELYLDKNGEQDIGLKRGRPLTLSLARYGFLLRLIAEHTASAHH